MRIIAHRGASAVAPENTLAALREGLRVGAAGAEIDVRLTADGEVVLLHDATLDRTTSRSGLLRRCTQHELTGVDAGGWRGATWRGEPIPRLADLLAEWPRDRRLFIELKDGPELLAPLAQVLRDRVGWDLVVLAFDGDLLWASQRVLPDRPHVRNVEAPPGAAERWFTDRAEEARAAGWAGLSFGVAAGWSADWPTRLRAAGLGCAVWTVDDTAQAGRLCADGVDDLMTNDPGRLRREIGA